MKRWLLGATLVGSMIYATPPAMAADGLWQHHHHNPAHATLYPVRAELQPTDGSPSMHRFDVKSSVQVSRETLRDAYDASRAAYTEKLKKYAKCSQSDAEKAVSAAHPGMKIQELQLRNIRTSLVYMAITQDNEDKYLVVVDAGNGKVLLDRPLPTHQEKAFAAH